MSIILVCLDAFEQGIRTGYASPARKLAVVALSGFYVAVVGWWAGGRIVSAWRGRDRDRLPPEDQLG